MSEYSTQTYNYKVTHNNINNKDKIINNKVSASVDNQNDLNSPLGKVVFCTKSSQLARLIIQYNKKM